MKNKLLYLSRLKQAILAVTLSSAVASTGLQADTVWADDFTGAALNTNLTAYNNGGGAGSTQSVGQLTMDTGVVNASGQAALNTATDSTGAVSTFNGEKLYNFYDHEVSASFGIDSITGTSGNNRNTFYFSIGDDATGNFAPQGNVLDDGIGFAMEQITSGWRLNYQALVSQAASGGVAALLSGVPTSITYTLDGTLATIDITGATFTTQGNAGTIIDTNTVTVALSDLSANISGYNLAFGAYNRGTVTEKTVVTLNSFDVSVIPEPGTYALLAGCLALTSVMVRRRR
jgi:hypothetical protein